MKIGKIIDQIYNKGGFTLNKLKLRIMSKENTAFFWAEHQGKLFSDFLIDYITSDIIVEMELIKKMQLSFIRLINVEKEAPNRSGLSSVIGVKIWPKEMIPRQVSKGNVL